MIIRTKSRGVLRKALLAAAVTVGLAGGSLAIGVEAASAATSPIAGPLQWDAGDGQGLDSGSGQFNIHLQGDGNLVLSTRDGRVLWNTGTGGHPNAQFNAQSDGNLVVRDNGTTLWTSKTGGNSAGTLALQNDGNFIWRDSGGKVLFATYTSLNSIGNSEGLRSGDQLLNGAFSLHMQSDGNLVALSGSTPIWSAGTGGNPGAYLAFQSDGSLVVRTTTKVLWNPGQAKGGKFGIDATGRVYLNRSDGSTLWESKSSSSQLLWPVSGYTTLAAGAYGAPRDGYSHQGQDLVVGVGTPIYGSGNGTVTAITNTGTSSSYGLYVTVSYGSYSVITAHMSSENVAVGQSVTSSTLLGKSGGAQGAYGAGDSTGPHVHVEVRKSGSIIDPNDIFKNR